MAIQFSASYFDVIKISAEWIENQNSDEFNYGYKKLLFILVENSCFFVC